MPGLLEVSSGAAEELLVEMLLCAKEGGTWIMCNLLSLG